MRAGPAMLALSPMQPMVLHSLFEGLAWVLAIAIGWWARRRYFLAALPIMGSRYPLYLLLLWLGAASGAYGLGDLNLALAGVVGSGRSILGAIVGGIAVAEIYKAITGVRGSTGAVFVLPLSIAIAVGRIGCFLAGLADYTYGTPTDLPWGVDFGDGIHRHPVQLYESFSMAGFALFFFLWLRRQPRSASAYGFYVFAGYYGAQRFVWEFLKPYPEVVGPLNVFHLAAAFLVIYAAFMVRRARRVHAVA
jgi:phosphatidylglycerol:prolipoprotein diacylglycerol transferase